MGKPADSNSP
jgi:hypothetical protein